MDINKLIEINRIYMNAVEIDLKTQLEMNKYGIPTNVGHRGIEKR